MHTAGRCYNVNVNGLPLLDRGTDRHHAKKKAALIRALLPTIEAALRSSQTLKDIWDTLDKQGLNIGYHVFRMTLWRARKSKAGTAPSGWEKITSPRTRSTHVRDVPTLEASDPLARLQNDWKPTDLGFHWRATPRRITPARGTEESKDKVER